MLSTLDYPSDDNPCPYLKYVLESDRCKGLKTALEERFSGNLSTSCAFHIKENVSTLYGPAPARYVVAIANGQRKSYQGDMALSHPIQVKQ